MNFKKSKWLIGILIVSLFLSGCAGLREGKETDPAILQLKEAIKQNPNDPEKHLELARIYGAKYDKTESMNYLESVIDETRKAIHLKPDLDRAHESLYRALWEKARKSLEEELIDELKREYEEVLRLKPELAISEDFRHYQIVAAMIYLDKSEKDKKYIDHAIKALKEVIQLKPEFAPAHALLGKIYYKKGKVELALLELKEAERLNPDDPGYHKALANIYKEKVHSEENCYDDEAINQGIKEYKEAIRLKPEDAEAHRELSYFYTHKGMCDLALFEAKEALRLNKSAKNHFWLGHAYLYNGNYDEARKEFEEALKLKSDYAEAYLYLACAYFSQNRFEDSIPVFKKYFELTEPSRVYSTGAILHYYLALKFRGKQSEAENLLQDYAKDFKGKEWESNLISYYQGRLTETDLISKAKNRCDNCDAFYYVGLQYLLNWDKPKAKEYFQKTVETKVYCSYEYVGAQAILEQLGEK